MAENENPVQSKPLSQLTLTNFADWTTSIRTLLVNIAIIGFVVLLLFVVVKDLGKRSVVIVDFEVSEDFTKKGYTGQVFANRLMGQMNYLQEMAMLPSSNRKYDVAIARDSRGKKGVLIDSIYSTANPNPIYEVEVPEAGFSLGTIVQALSFRAPSPRVVGDIKISEQDNTQYVLSVQVIGKPAESFTGTVATLDSIDDNSMRLAAEYIYYNVSPFTLASYRYNEGRVVESEEIIRHCLINDSHDDDYLAYNLWAMIFLDRGRYKESVQMFERAISSNPDAIPTALISWGSALYSEKRYDEAILKYRTAISLNIQSDSRLSAMAYSNWGLVDAVLERNEAAAFKFRRATELDPTYVLAYNNWGSLERTKRNYDEAIEKFKLAIVLDPTFGLAYYNLGLTYQYQSNPLQSVAEQESTSENASYNFKQAVKHLPCGSPESDWALFALKHSPSECKRLRVTFVQEEDDNSSQTASYGQFTSAGYAR